MLLLIKIHFGCGPVFTVIFHRKLCYNSKSPNGKPEYETIDLYEFNLIISFCSVFLRKRFNYNVVFTQMWLCMCVISAAEVRVRHQDKHNLGH